MIGAGLALDVGLYHRALPYQPGWAAVPLGLLELAATMALVSLFDIAALTRARDLVLRRIVAARAGARPRRSAADPSAYAEDGGELGGSGAALVALAPTALLLVLGTAWATQPPTVHLAAGVHQGPIVIERQMLVGEPGAIVRGGIVVLADDVTIRDITVDRRRERNRGRRRGRRPSRARLGLGRRARRHPRSPLVGDDPGLHDRLPRQPVGPGDRHLVRVGQAPQQRPRLHVVGGLEGIVTHFVMAAIEENRVSRTQFRAISMTEMSMGTIPRNEVWGAMGVGIFCNDMSMCEVEDNVVVATRPDRSSGDLSRPATASSPATTREVELQRQRARHEPGAGRRRRGCAHRAQVRSASADPRRATTPKGVRFAAAGTLVSPRCNPTRLNR